MKKVLVYNLAFIIYNSFCFSQNAKIDSLLTLLKTDKEDTNKVIHLYTLTNEYRLIGEYENGLSSSKKALAVAQNLGFKRGIANSYNGIGNIYYTRGNHPEALKNYYAALKIREEIKDKKGISSSYNNIGNIYTLQGNYPEALKNHFAALKIREEIKDKYLLAWSYDNIAFVYGNQGKLTEALKMQITSLNIREEIKDKQGISHSYGNIGAIYEKQKNYPEALKNYFAALKIDEEIDNKEGIGSSNINIGQLYVKLNRTKEAETYLNNALQLNKFIGLKYQIKNSYAALTLLDSTMATSPLTPLQKRGEYWKATFECHKQYVIYRDSLDNEETKKKSLQASMQYEFDKKEIKAKAEQERLDAINAEEKKKQQLFLILVTCILILVGVFAAFMFNRFRVTSRQKVIIEKQKQQVDKAYETLHEKNKEVMDSIRYASRIQRALITSEKYIEKSLSRLINNNKKG